MDLFGPLVENTIMRPSEDREYLVPVWEPRAVDGYLSGMRSTYSRFSHGDRFYRSVLKGMRREFGKTGRIRINLLPRDFTTGVRGTGLIP